MDFEADVSTMCSEIHPCMATDFAEDFGPDIVLEPGKEHKDMNSEEYEFYREERGKSETAIKESFWLF